MRFLFSDPFRKVAGNEREIALAEPVSLRTLINRFPPDLITMIPHGDQVTDVELWAQVMFFNRVRLLKLDDMIDDDEEVKVLLPATGG
ncbi:MAG: hypothetical protein ACYC7J_04670 [Syntrophales bacterium]